MGTHPDRRLLWLFLAIVFLPCIALLTISLRIASQERELSERRRRESRGQAVQQLGHELLGHLERLKRQELARAQRSPPRSTAGRRDPASILIAPIVGDRILLPWESEDAAQNARLRDEPFTRAIREGERLEIARSFRSAAASYRRAMVESHGDIQRGYARLLRARALLRGGREAEALEEHRAVLALPVTMRDEYGVPLSFYAAEALVAARPGEVVARLTSELEDSMALSPPAFYMLRDLLTRANEGDASEPHVSGRLSEQQDRLERVLSLSGELGQLWPVWSAGRRDQSAEPVWLLWGEPPWLLSAVQVESNQPWLLVADASEVFRQFEAHPMRPRFHAGSGEAGHALGQSFPGLRVTLLSTGDALENSSEALRRSLYWLVVLLVVTVALFGTYLLLHGVRRELRLAALRTQFVSSVSHELKTPLTAIRMFAESLRMGRPSEPAAKAEYLDTIISESERLTRLLNNVLDFSNLEHGTTSYQRRTVHLQEVVSAAARAVQYPLTQQGFELETEIDETVHPVQADADAMQQAVLNLLSNAIKYSGASRWIQMGLRTENGDAIIEVRDRGVGIALREQRRIFEKFYRVASPVMQQIPGTGLGLTLVEQVAAGHGGRVEVESAPGEGSTFRLRLPLESVG